MWETTKFIPVEDVWCKRMSSEVGGGNKASSRSGEKSTTGEPSSSSLEGTASAQHQTQQKQPSITASEVHSTPSTSGSTVEPEGEHATEGDVEESDRKPAARPSQEESAAAPSEVSPASAFESDRPRQVIAVSANRGPTAFFNLAKRFLITDELCDLSALEGAIVSAVDAAHLLERSKLATIVR